MQIGPMHVKEFGTVQAWAITFQRHAKCFFGRIPVSSNQSFRQEANLIQGVPRSESFNDFDGVGCHLYAGPYLAELRGSFEQVVVDTALA